MNSIILYFSLILTLFQSTIFGANEINIANDYKIIEQKISNQSSKTHSDFQDTFILIDEKNEDEMDSIKSRIMLQKLAVFMLDSSNLFSILTNSCGVNFMHESISLNAAPIFLINRVIRL